jgi:hypothetical protein
MFKLLQHIPSVDFQITSAIFLQSLQSFFKLQDHVQFEISHFVTYCSNFFFVSKIEMNKWTKLHGVPLLKFRSCEELFFKTCLTRSKVSTQSFQIITQSHQFRSCHSHTQILPPHYFSSWFVVIYNEMLILFFTTKL